VNKVLNIGAGIALVAVIAFQQAEIQVIHDDVQDIKQYLIHTNERLKYTQTEFNCLAKNIYHEAGVEPIEGKFAVAQVTLNRLKKGRWGDDICSVVHAKSQFSWTLSKRKLNEQPKGELWNESQQVARIVLDKGVRVPSLAQSTFYHADYVKPLWSKSVVKIKQVGQHIFYKYPPTEKLTVY
jgi:spore germination cell wall hydrolase CwlJ-like protein